MNFSKFLNGDLWRVPAHGGSVRVTIASNVGQGNGGTSKPCKACYVVAPPGNTSYIVMNVGVAATSILGTTVPAGPSGATITINISTSVSPPPDKVEIDDMNKLYFWGATDGDVVDIRWRE